MLTIKYGIIDNNIDVTSIAYDKLIRKSIIEIPSGDVNRATYFTDPIVGTLKSIFIDLEGVTTEYDDTKNIYIDTINNTVYFTSNNTELITPDVPEYVQKLWLTDIKLKKIHSQLKIEFGSFNDEYPEQVMVSNYLLGKEKVLEIGSNIGRNSLVIGYILNQQGNNNFVTLESDTEICQQLITNKDINSLDFYIENAALSKRNLIQSGWDTIVSDDILENYKKVNTITWEELNKKYNIEFDTLILDCEGAFYYILLDMPEILTNIKLIIMENDYRIIEQKNIIDSILKENNFYVDYSKEGGWGPCYPNFYQVWMKTIYTLEDLQ